uniref:uncharacterized protein LOC101303082 n=1 Tax=Fragaria vesca subsp. vesca TaxID=101020 RepID=UPI0005C9ACA9
MSLVSRSVAPDAQSRTLLSSRSHSLSVALAQSLSLTSPARPPRPLLSPSSLFLTFWKMAGTMSSSASNATSEMDRRVSLKRNSSDVGWEYGIMLLESRAKWHHVPRLRQRLKPNARMLLLKSKVKKIQKTAHEEEVRQEVLILDGAEDEEASQGTRRQPHTLGPMDKFANIIDPDATLSGSKNTRQQNIHDTLFKERTHSVHQFLARWVYEVGIPFHAIDNDSFKRFVEAVGQFGPGYRPPSQYLLREPLLKEEVDRTKSLLKTQEQEWASNGCSIMTDAWSDRKRRSIMNLCVNCKEGTTFLSSKEASNESHTGAYIFEYVDKCIEVVGPQNVVQVVTDNASNNMAAGELMKVKRPSIFWTSCATHTLNLMLQGIGNLPRFKGVIEKAKSFTIYIYAHHKTLALMRKYTKKRDIVRPGVTRFATAFLTLQSLMEKKNELRAMITSSEWSETKHAKSVKGKAAMNIALSASFWNGVNLSLKVFAPLVKVLRIVDGDRKPSMGFVYGEQLELNEEIKKVFKDQEAHYRPILDIVDAKARDRLDSPLHVAAYLLNPYYTFADPSLENDEVVMDGFFTCVEKLFPDIQTQNLVINIELHKYLKKEGLFGRNVAKEGCKQNDDAYDP